MAIDDTDPAILREVVLTPLPIMGLAREIGCCSLTIRRINALTARELAVVDDAKKHAPTEQGIAALVPAAPALRIFGSHGVGRERRHARAR